MTIGPQPELPIDPPAEIEVDPELLELVENAARRRLELESDGIKLSEANLLTPEQDEKWVNSFEAIDALLFAATERLGEVSRKRREAEAHADA